MSSLKGSGQAAWRHRICTAPHAPVHARCPVSLPNAHLSCRVLADTVSGHSVGAHNWILTWLHRISSPRQPCAQRAGLHAGGHEPGVRQLSGHSVFHGNLPPGPGAQATAAGGTGRHAAQVRVGVAAVHDEDFAQACLDYPPTHVAVAIPVGSSIYSSPLTLDP